MGHQLVGTGPPVGTPTFTPSCCTQPGPRSSDHALGGPPLWPLWPGGSQGCGLSRKRRVLRQGGGGQICQRGSGVRVLPGWGAVHSCPAPTTQSGPPRCALHSCRSSRWPGAKRKRTERTWWEPVLAPGVTTQPEPRAMHLLLPCPPEGLAWGVGVAWPGLLAALLSGLPPLLMGLHFRGGACAPGRTAGVLSMGGQALSPPLRPLQPRACPSHSSCPGASAWRQTVPRAS